MPVLQLTKRNIDKVKFTDKGQVDYFDTELKGLFLRVGQSSKTFYVKTEVRELVTGELKTVKAKIGRYGEITPEDARKKAPEVMQLLREGKPASKARIHTLRDIFERFIRDKPLAATTITAYGTQHPTNGCA